MSTHEQHRTCHFTDMKLLCYFIITAIYFDHSCIVKPIAIFVFPPNGIAAISEFCCELKHANRAVDQLQTDFTVLTLQETEEVGNQNALG